MTDNLSTLQAFKAMKNFLEGYYYRTNSDDVGSLLTDMEFLKDGRTLDPAAWNDWLDAIKEVLKEENIKKVS